MSEDEDWRRFATALGVRITRLRIEQGLTQEAVAYRAGLTRFTYQRYEKGESQAGHPSNPTLLSLIALAQVFGVSIQDLLPPEVPDVTAR